MSGWRCLAAASVTLLVVLLASRQQHPDKLISQIVPSATPFNVVSSPLTESDFEPICSVDWRRASCMRGSVETPCPEKPHAGATPIGTGAWELTDTYVYFLDRGLLAAMVALVDGGSVLEFGAGKGCYTAAFKRNGIATRAYDGSPQVADLTHGLVQSSDLTVPLHLGVSDWVVCLEVAEHIPREHEETFLKNLLSHARRGLIISWSNNQGGNGHVNLRSNEWVIEAMRERGFEHDPAAQKALRTAITAIHWYSETVLVFRRFKGKAQERPGRRRQPFLHS